MVLNFSEFILENTEEEGKKLKHLTHLEDHVIHGGHQGVGLAAQHLEDTHNILLGKKSSSTVTTKYDGSPSIVFGTHPETGKFFVASKSAFNKDPKINYTPEDIERNHGHAPGLVEKLKAALQHLPKIMPKNGGVYQGDLMYTKGDVQKKNGMSSITPNTITYSVPNDSPHGKRMDNAQMGVVVHTKYQGGKKLENMGAAPLDSKTRNQFAEHPDVHNIDPTIDANPQNYTPEEQKQYAYHMGNVKRAYAGMKPEAMDALQGHGPALEMHINKSVREGSEPSAEGYMNDVAARAQKEIDKVKTPAAKERKAQESAKVLQHIGDNMQHFKKALEVHGHLQKAKNVLVGVMAKNNPFTHTIGGETTGPEGAVIFDKHGNSSKEVDREEFSRQNALRGLQGQLAKERKSINEEKVKSLVMAHVRMNPIHEGHGEVVRGVTNEAKRTGADHLIVLSHTHDNKKNPLTPEQKLKHARRAFPGVNFTTSSPEQPNLLSHLSNAYANGYRKVTVVGGSDRDTYADLALKYRGVPSKHGFYGNDMEINFKQAGGERNEGDEGITGYSASKMRKAAEENTAESRRLFHSMAPKNLTSSQKDDLLNDTRAGLKKIHENTTAAIGGLGFNTGNPSVDGDALSNYVAQSTADADTRDNVLKGMINKSYSNKTHARVGFSAFDPKSLKGKK